MLRARADTEKIYVVTTVFGLVVRNEPLTTRVPDLAVFQASRIVDRNGCIHSTPELIVEVLSPAKTLLREGPSWQTEGKRLPHIDYVFVGAGAFACQPGADTHILMAPSLSQSPISIVVEIGD